MKKLLRSVLLALPMVMGLSFVSSCGEVEETPELTQLQQLERIYEIVKANGFEGSFEEWMQSLQGDQVELRAENGFIQWRYSDGREWVNLIPLTELKGASGVDGLTPYVGANGNWWVGEIDTKVVAQAKDGEDGLDGLTPYVGDNGNWWIGDIDTNVVAQAQDGENGLTPYVGDNGNWWIGDIDTNVVAVAKDGEDGLTPYVGENGNWWIGDIDTQVVAVAQDGLTPYVGENGNWWIGDIDTNVVAVAKDGLTPYVGDNGNWWIGDIDTQVVAVAQDGLTPYIGENGNWWIGDIDTNVVAVAKDGLTPYVGDNGNWWIGDIDTNVVAVAKDGKDGLTPYIGENGNWWIGETDTNVKSSITGATGKSAYELFKELHPEYDGDEAKWLDDLVNGRLSEGQFKYFTVTFDINEIDESNICDVKNIELYSNGSLINEVLPTETLRFDGLLSGVNYTLKVNYSYDLNEGNDLYQEYQEYNFATEALARPEIVISDITTTHKTIDATISINDFNGIDELVAVKLFLGDQLIETGTSLNLSYQNLVDNSEYTIVVEHIYDLNDGNGRVSYADYFYVSTHPVYQLLETNILNTSAIVEDDMVYIHAVVDNPSSATFKSVFINGVEYEVNPSSTSSDFIDDVFCTIVFSTSIFCFVYFRSFCDNANSNIFT